MELPDWAFFEHSQNADSDPDAAAQALLVFARRVKNREPLKPEVAAFIADAFEKSMTLPQKQRGAALLRALKLTYGGRRPVKANYYHVGKEFDRLTESGEKRSGAIIELALRYEIDESTVVRLLKEYREGVEEDDRLRAENSADWE
jgi:hypothetical protein